MAFLTQEQLSNVGFKSIGENVLISDKASIYNAKNISLGSHVRIDDFCILSAGDGGIFLSDYIHIACYCSLIGKGKIVLKDFSGLSARVSVYSSNDDYSGRYMTNPCVPTEYTNVTSGDVTIEKHVIIGSGTIVLPNVTVGYGAAIGAMSLVSKSCEGKTIYLGNPLKRLKSRKLDFEELEKKMLNE